MAEDGTEILGSNEPARNGYGQNGFEGPASDTNMPGKKKTTSGFLPQVVLPSAKTTDQTRPMSAEQKVPTTFGMRNVSHPSHQVQIQNAISHQGAAMRGRGRGR